MIKINLLPLKAARKREYVKQQLILGAVLLVAAVLGVYLWNASIANRIADKNKKIAETKAEIEKYKAQIGELEAYKGLDDALKRKLKIIEDLEKGRSGPVRVLDRLCQIIPNQVWLMKWEEKALTVSVEGEALSLKHIGNFLTVLEQPEDESASVGASPEAAPSADKPQEGQPAPAPPAVAPEIKQPAKEGRRYFSNIRLVDTRTVDDKTFRRSFVQFKISLTVTYSI